MTTNVNKTWGDLFDDVYDIDKDGKLNELEGRIFLGTVYRKPLSQIQTSMLSNNILKWNVINMKRSSFELWRKRTSGRKTKHTSLSQSKLPRFKSSDQK